jgi:hypothetical protein
MLKEAAKIDLCFPVWFSTNFILYTTPYFFITVQKLTLASQFLIIIFLSNINNP